MRFIHTSDWQLGKPFGKMPPDARAALQDARLDAIDTLAGSARENRAPVVLIAGDVFDSPEPGDRIFRQALSRMKGASDLRWILLPGNHDPARADGLWSRLRAEAPENVACVLDRAVFEIADGVSGLPAPLAFRRTTDDPTAWFDDAETAVGTRRIGIAHGSIRKFDSAEETTNLIAVDRARRAGLDYLALGDWHNRQQIDERTAYSGTPEPDDFGREFTGEALLVELGATGEPPTVTPLPIARYEWINADWTISEASDLERYLSSLQQSYDLKRLVARIAISGVVTLRERVEVRERLGLLWVEQGQSFVLGTPGASARRTLEEVLAGEVGVVTGGRRTTAVVQAVEKSLAEFLTPGGKPNKRLQEAQRQVVVADQAVVDAEAEFRQFEEALDRLGAKRGELARILKEIADPEHQAGVATLRTDLDRARVAAQVVQNAELVLQGATGERARAEANSVQRKADCDAMVAVSRS